MTVFRWCSRPKESMKAGMELNIMIGEVWVLFGSRIPRDI